MNRRILTLLSFASLLLLAFFGVMALAQAPAGLAAPAAGPSVYYVAIAGSDERDCLSPETACRTVRAAVEKAAGGDTIVIDEGEYSEHLTLDKDLTLLGKDAARTILNGTENGRVVSVETGATVSLAKITLTGGRSDGGGAVRNAGDLSLDRCVVTRSYSTGHGGGISNASGASLYLSYSTISDNSSDSTSGGLINFGQAELWNSAVVNNRARENYGGGIHNNTQGTMTLRNVTVSGNLAPYGTGVSNSGSLAMTNATIAFNHAITGTSSSGISNHGTMTSKNSIVAENDHRNCAGSGTFTSLGHNLEGPGDTCNFHVSGDLAPAYAGLGPLADNGGPTPTHEVDILQDSDAVDRGDNNGCPTKDQRGAPRPVAGGGGVAICDIGAFESRSNVPRPQANPMVQRWTYDGAPVVEEGSAVGEYLSLVVGNDGEANIEAKAGIELYLSTDSDVTSGDVQLVDGKADLPSLGISEFASVPLPAGAAIPLGVEPGRSYLGVVLDSTDVIMEKSEKDNSAAAPVFVLPQGPYTWTVTSAADTMQWVTLRLALTYARAGDRIHFSEDLFRIGRPSVISLTQPLPEITQGELVVDATDRGVILDGSALAAGVAGLVVRSDRNEVSGLEIRSTPGNGLEIIGDRNLVGRRSTADCDIPEPAGPPFQGPSNQIHGSGGTGLLIYGSGNEIKGNHLYDNGRHGISIESGSENAVGSNRPGEGNVAGGNGAAGIRILSATTSSNMVQGNYVGTSLGGSSPHPNQTGIYLESTGEGTEVGGAGGCSGNLVSGNSEWGIRVRIAGENTRIRGNIVGANSSGEPVGNGSGIWIDSTAGAQVGGSRMGDGCGGECNLVNANAGPGILVSGASSRGVRVTGNFVGTDRWGRVGFGNGGAGIEVTAMASDTQIGGPVQEANLISDNAGAGIEVHGNDVLRTTIGHNTIGLTLDGQETLANDSGVWVYDGAWYTLIEGNAIAGNANYGVHIQSDQTRATALRFNVIGSNLARDPGLGNGGAGVYLSDGAATNEIGDGNTIMQNGNAGIWMVGGRYNDVFSNTISHNLGNGLLIGNSRNTDIDDNEITRNQGNGLELYEGSDWSQARDNQVVDNEGYGIVIFGGSSHSTIAWNEISSNLGPGISIFDDCQDNDVLGNQVSRNGGDGVQVIGANAINNKVSENAIWGNELMRLNNVAGGNTELPPPSVEGSRRLPGQDRWEIRGVACPGCRVELFINTPGSTSVYTQTATAGATDGAFSFQEAIPPGSYFDLTARELNGNTSEYLSDHVGKVDLEITKIDVVQTFDGPVTNYAGKPSYVRVHAVSDGESMPVLARATLEIERGGRVLDTITPFPNETCPLEIEVKAHPDRGEIQDAFCFLLDPAWTQAGEARFTASLTSFFSEDPNTANDTLSVTTSFTDTAPLPLRLFLLTYPETLRDTRVGLRDEYAVGDQLIVIDADDDGRAEIIVGRAGKPELDLFELVPAAEKLTAGPGIPASDVSGYHRGDLLAGGNVDGNLGAEVVIGHPDTDDLFVWAYSPGASAWLLMSDSVPLTLETTDRLALGDLDGDGRDDAVIGSEDGTVRVLIASGSWLNPFQPAQQVATAHEIGDVVVADVDFNGDNEVILGDRQTGNVVIYTWSNGALSPFGGLGDQIAAHFDADSRLAAGDMDNDLSSGSQLSEILVAQQNLDGRTVRAVSIFAWDGANWERVVLADGWGNDGLYTAGGSIGVGHVGRTDDEPELIAASPDTEDILVYEKVTGGAWRSLAATQTYERETLSHLERILPIGEIDLQGVTPLQLDVMDGTPRYNLIYGLMEEFRQSEGLPDTTYLTLMDGADLVWGGEMSGRRCVSRMYMDGAHTEFGSLVTAAHEVAHTRWRAHALVPPCGLSGLASPYPEGVIASLPDPFTSGVLVLDVTQPQTPTLVGAEYDLGFWQDVAVQDNYLFMSNYYAEDGPLGDVMGGMASYRLADPVTLQLQHRLLVQDGTGTRMAGGVRRIEVAGDYAYLADIFGGLIVVDVSTPHSLQEVDRFELPAYTDENWAETAPVPHLMDIHVEGTQLLAVDYPYLRHNAAGRFGGHLRVFDVTNPADLQLTRLITPTDRPNGVFALGTDAYVATDSGLEIYDLAAAEGQELVGQVAIDAGNTDSMDVFVSGSFAYVASTRGLEVVDIGNPAQPALAHTVPVGHSNDVEVAGSYAYLASRLNGLQIVDVSNPAAATAVGEYDPPGTPSMATGLDVVGNRVYLTAWDAMLYGFDAGDLSLGMEPQIFSGYEYKDMMSYCSKKWASYQTYEGVRQELLGVAQKADAEKLASATPGAEAPNGTLLIAAHVSPADVNGGFDLLYRDPDGMPLSSLPATSTAHVLLLNSSGGTIVDYALNLLADQGELGDEPRYSIADVVPWVPGTAEVQLVLDGIPVARAVVSPNAPQVTLLAPTSGQSLGAQVEVSWTAADPDGDQLLYTLLASTDGGTTWRAVAGRLRDTAFTLDTGYLCGSDRVRFRVVANDGVNTGSDQSDGDLILGSRPPEVAIASPVNGGAYEVGQAILLLAEASDPDCKPLDAGSFRWASDADGPLGTGESLYIDTLSPGWHTLTLEVTDADGQTATALMRIQIGDAASFEVYLPLVVR